MRILAQEVIYPERESFSFETTLSGKAYTRYIPRWQSDGFVVTLIFLSLPSAEIAVARVRQRVSEGGHDVPVAVIRRRFVAGLANFQGLYRPLVDRWYLYDNSGEAPTLLDRGERGQT